MLKNKRSDKEVIMRKRTWGKKITVSFHGKPEDKIYYFECKESQEEVRKDVEDFVGWLMKHFVYNKIIIEGYHDR